MIFGFEFTQNFRSFHKLSKEKKIYKESCKYQVRRMYQEKLINRIEFTIFFYEIKGENFKQIAKRLKKIKHPRSDKYSSEYSRQRIFDIKKRCLQRLNKHSIEELRK